MSWPSGRHECEASSRVKTSRPIEARRHQMAVARRGGRSNVAGCRQHSDRGSQFGSRRIWRRWGGQRACRVDGQGRHCRRQCGDGVALRPVAEERHRQTRLGRLAPVEFEMIQSLRRLPPPEFSCQ